MAEWINDLFMYVFDFYVFIYLFDSFFCFLCIYKKCVYVFMF